MPIAGLTDTPKAFMKLGMIKKGDRGGKNGAPRDLDYFRITYQPGTKAKELESQFKSIYGESPTEINVRFADSDPFQVWDANYECYKQGGLVAKVGSRDTGPYWIFYRDPNDSEVLVRNGSPVGERGRDFFEKPIDLAAPVYFTSKKEPVFFEPVGRLQVVIPELAHLAVGFFTFQPGSPRDIRNITAELTAYDALARSAGKSITGIPFKLIRRQEEVTKKIDGKLTKGQSWVVHLIVEGEWSQKAIEVIERLALPEVIDAESSYVDEHDFGGDEPPALTSGTTPLVQMPYETAKQVIIKSNSGKELFMSELKKEQLERVVKSPESTNEQKLAAQSVLATDHK